MRLPSWSPYRVVVAGVLIGAIALMAVLPFLRTDDSVELLTTIVIIEFIAGVLASTYLTILNITSRTRPRSWILLTLATTSWEVTAGALFLIVILVVNLSGSKLPPGVGLTFVGMSFVLMLAAPITKALVFYLSERQGAKSPHNRRSGDVTP
jgi:peptidoglycan/LPS O-acetylase OafA/YrhL